MGHVYVEITLNNMFLGKTVEVSALVDTGAFLMGITPSIATELGFDLEEMSTRMFTLADGSSAPRPVVPLEVKWQDRRTTCDASVMGDKCVMGVLALEGMGLIVDPVQQRLIPNPSLKGGPLLLGGLSAAVFSWLTEGEPPPA